MKTIFTPFLNSLILCVGISMFAQVHLFAFSNHSSDSFSPPKKSQQDVVQISPEGDRVAYLRNGFIWVADINQPSHARKIVIKGKIHSWQWTYNHALLIVHEADSEMGILNVNIDRFTQTDVTPFPLHSVQILAKSPKRPDTIAVSIEAKKDSQNGIYHLHLHTGKAYRITDLGDYNDRDFDSELHIKA